MDLALFWKENAESANKPFRTDKPRVPISLSFDDHWLLEEMQPPAYIRYYQEPEYRAELNRQTNDRMEPVIGIRPFNEQVEGPPLLRIEEVFGSRIEVVEGGTPWLEPGVKTPEELVEVLDRVERLSDPELDELLCSKGFSCERKERQETAWCRGPATIGTSVVGTTELMFWLIDEPEIMGRFYETLAATIIRYREAIHRITGVKTRGFAWLDDNCALFSPSLYEEFCLPVMKEVFGYFSPEPDDYRFQHSDSAMSHLFPLLAPLNFHGVNFGPTIPVEDIRAAMPNTVIHGQLAPFTLRNDGPDAVRNEVLRDFNAVGADGGLFMTTAGSIAAGTTLKSVRHWMEVVHNECRYD